MKQLNQRLPLLTAMLVTVQPLLDAVAYWNRVWGVSNLWTMVLRLLLLVPRRLPVPRLPPRLLVHRNCSILFNTYSLAQRRFPRRKPPFCM